MVNLALPCFSESSDLPDLVTGRGETARCIRREKSSNVSARYARNAAALVPMLQAALIARESKSMQPS